MSIIKSLTNLNISESCFNDIVSLIEANIEDSPLYNACNDKYLSREQSDAYTAQLEQDKKEYNKKQAAIKRKLNRKPKPIDPSKVPGQLKLFEAWEVEETMPGSGRYKVWKPESGDIIKHTFKNKEYAQKICNDYNKSEKDYREKNASWQ